MYMYRATEKHKWVRTVTQGVSTLQSPLDVLKTDNKVYKQAKSMCPSSLLIILTIKIDQW